MKKVRTETLLRSIREALGFSFLFTSKNIPFVRGYIFTLLDFFQGSKNLLYVHFVLKKMFDDNLISANGVSEGTFTLENSVFYDVYIRNYDGRMYSRGTSRSREEAYAKAVGEIFERQNTQASERGKKIVFLSIQQLKESGATFVDPTYYHKPTKLQIETFKGRYEFDENTVFGWVAVCDLFSENKVLILAQDAYWSYKRKEGEPCVTNMSTNGCGGGYTLESAIKSAHFEIVQRDTFFRYWYFNSSPPKIRIETLPEDSEVMKTVRELQKKSFVVELLDMTDVAGLPTVTCILYKENTGWFVGASTSETKLQAIERALQESFSVYMWMYSTISQEGYDVYQDFFSNSPLEGFIDTRITDEARCLLWGSKWYKDTQDMFLIEGEHIDYKEEGIPQTFILSDYMKAKYGASYTHVITNKILDEYTYFSVKAIVPSAYSLALYENETLAVKDNTYPQNKHLHPFP